MFRIAIAFICLASAGCAPSVNRRQCEYIGTHGPAEVARHFNWSGYYDCQGRWALVPVLVGNHLDLGVFDFKERRVAQLLGPDDGGNTIGGVTSKFQWVLSPNENYVIWIQVQAGAPTYLIGPKVRIYDLHSDKRFVVMLPPRTAEAMHGTWQFEGFSHDGNEAIFDLFARNEKAIVDLRKGLIVVKKVEP